MRTQRQTVKPLLSLIVMGAMWGLQFSMLKFAALSDTGLIDLLMWTLMGLAVVFSLYVWIVGDSLRFPARWMPFLLVTALLGYVVPLGLTLGVAPHISVGTLSMIACLAPIMTVVTALIFRTESVSSTRILAIALGLVSVLLMLWPEWQSPGWGAMGWMIIALGIALVYGIEPVYVQARWPTGMSAPQLIAGEAIAAIILLLPLFLWQGSPFRLFSVGHDALWPLSIFAAAGMVETVLYFHLIRTAGGVFVSFGTFISLFAGIAWGMLLFSERHGVFVWLAVVFLVGALTLSCRHSNPEAVDRTARP